MVRWLMKRVNVWTARGLWLVVPGLALALAACAAPVSGPLAVGDPAPDFRLRNVDGATISLADFRDQRPVLLFFHMAVG